MKLVNLSKSPKSLQNGGKSLVMGCVVASGLLLAVTASSVFASSSAAVLDSSNARYHIENGVATISGTAENTVEKHLIERIVLRLGNVEEVRNELKLMQPELKIDDNIGAIPVN